MKRLFLISFVSILYLIVILSCARKSGALRSFPLDSADGIIAHEYVIFDKDISADGKGSLRVVAHEPLTVPLIEITDLKIENAQLAYTAKVRTEHVIGQVYLEMVCHFPNRGDVVSRGQETLLSGTNDWKEQQTSLDLQKGDLPDSVKLNLVINGRGTVWIDDIKLLSEPLKP